MKSKHKRIFWAITLPPLALMFAVMLSGLASLLADTAAGQILMWTAIALVCAKIGCMAWYWPGWTDDDRR